MLLVHGENGTGKTRCRKGIERWYWKAGRTALFVPRADLVRVPELQSWSWPNLLDHLKEGGWGIVEDLCKCELLLIDELGGGYDPSFIGVDKLCQILSARENKWTMIVTNIRPDAMESTFDRRVASRIMRNSTIVDLSDVPDYNA
jgi:DNA replication protein DnaC